MLRKFASRIYVAYSDLTKGTPLNIDLFDVAPHLSEWTNNETSPLLLQLVEYIDRNDLHCDSNFSSQGAIWRITDNAGTNDTIMQLLLDAGIDIGQQDIDYPRISNPNSNSTETSNVIPPEVTVVGNTPSNPVTVPALSRIATLLLVLILFISSALTYRQRRNKLR